MLKTCKNVTNHMDIIKVKMSLRPRLTSMRWSNLTISSLSRISLLRNGVGGMHKGGMLYEVRRGAVLLGEGEWIRLGELNFIF
jgi:hypothetical protein